MDKHQRKLISQFADKLEDDGAVTESMYGVPVKRGNAPIDQLIHQIEMNFVDWDWNSKAFQKVMAQVYRGQPPATPQSLSKELASSIQDPALLEKLGALTLAAKPATPAQAPAPVPQTAIPGSQPQVRPSQAPTIAPAQQAPAQPIAKPNQNPRQAMQNQNPIQLQWNKTYTVVYENFRGQQLTFHNATFKHHKGPFAIFECPRPAGRPNPSWHRGKKLINNQADIQNKQAELAQTIADTKALIAKLPNRRHRVHGGWYTLAQLRQRLPGWVKSIQSAVDSIKRTEYSLNNSIQNLTLNSQNIRLTKPLPMRKSLRADKIISAK